MHAECCDKLEKEYVIKQIKADKQTSLIQEKQEKLERTLQLMTESLLTSDTKFVKLFPQLAELGENYKESVFVPLIKDIKPLSTNHKLNAYIKRES